jgi:hypothetical protein
MSHLQYAVHFCLAARKNLVPTLHYSLGTLSPKIVVWADTINQRCIMSMPVSMPSDLGPSNTTMQDMTSYLATLTETTAASYMLDAVRDGNKSNGFKKLGAHHQRMIIKASTVYVNLPMMEPLPSLVAFLDQKTSGLAQAT